MISSALPLAGNVVLVTGGSGGIGSAICRRMAQAGATVGLTYRRQKLAAEQLLTQMPAGRHFARPLAVTDTPALRELASEINSVFGHLDILVNCAGTTKFVAHGDLDGLDDEVIDHIFQVNWRGSFACVRAFRSLLEKAQPGPGLVVNISSIAGATAIGSNIAYCASKAAVDSMTKALARALAPKVRVVSVSPGLVDTEFVKGLDQAWRDEQAARTPLRRLAKAEEAAEAVYAVAVHLPYSNGCIIPVDGGRPLT